MALIRVTAAKLAANRANGKLSRGPITPEGKARSAQNATKFGFTAALKGMPPDWHEAALVKAEQISSEFSDPTERELIAKHVYLIIWRRYIAHLEAHALNQFPNWLAIIREPGLFTSINRACARADHLARRVETALARYRKLRNNSASTNPYLIETTTPRVARAPANRERQRTGGPATVRERSIARADNFASTNPYLSDFTGNCPHILDSS